MRAELSGDRKEGTWHKEEGWGCGDMEGENSVCGLAWWYLNDSLIKDREER